MSNVRKACGRGLTVQAVLPAGHSGDAQCPYCRSPATLVARIVEEKLAEIASELMIEEQSTHDRSSRAA